MQDIAASTIGRFFVLTGFIGLRYTSHTQGLGLVLDDSHEGTVHAGDLCIRTWPPEERVAALVTSYFDDSRRRICVLSGYSGYINQWNFFEELWSAALKRHDVPYFHMREMGDPSGVFAKWHPPEDHQEEVL